MFDNIKCDNPHPLHDNVLLKLELVKSTDGGLVLPDSVRQEQESILCGFVVAKGPGTHSNTGVWVEANAKIAIGARVVIGQFSCSPFDLNGEPHVLIREGNILMVV